MSRMTSCMYDKGFSGLWFLVIRKNILRFESVFLPGVHYQLSVWVCKKKTPDLNH
jgi:hypothetical protein